MICRVCTQDKSAQSFRLPKGKRTPRTECRDCERAVSLAHARAHAEERRAYSRTYSKEHRAERTAYQRRRVAEKGRPVRTEGQIARRRETERLRDAARTPEQRRSDADRWRVYFRERHARLYADDPLYRERMLVTGRRNKKARPELHRMSQHRRRVRLQNGLVEPVDFERVVARDESRCYLCGRELERRAITFDHVVPVARGGPHSEDNLRVACKPCNSRKGSKLLSEIAERAHTRPASRTSLGGSTASIVAAQ